MREAETISDVQQAVRELPRVSVVGGGTKDALSREANLAVRALSGVLEYEPGEYTFTALAGTPIAEVNQMLAEHGQYLPFDPPLVDAGATLGGTVATGLSGPGRFRYGGVRDFLLGVRLVNGEGELIYGGGKVVKNAAGFDIPKLTIGSLGRFGVLVELTFKVFPAREASATLIAEMPNLDACVSTLTELATSGAELDCLDLEPPNKLWLRVSGMQSALTERVNRLREMLSSATTVEEVDDSQVWHAVREFAWVPAESGVVKVPISPADILSLESTLKDEDPNAPRRYSVGGNVAWLAWPPDDEVRLGSVLDMIQRPGLAIRGAWPEVAFGEQENAFAARLAAVFDPQAKFSQCVEQPMP